MKPSTIKTTLRVKRSSQLQLYRLNFQQCTQVEVLATLNNHNLDFVTPIQSTKELDPMASLFALRIEQIIFRRFPYILDFQGL